MSKKKVELHDLLFDIQCSIYSYTCSSLRGVTVGIKNKIITVIFYYDGVIDGKIDEKYDLVSMAETELMASSYRTVEEGSKYNFEEYEGYRINSYYMNFFQIQQVDFPISLNDKKLDYWIYQRREFTSMYQKDLINSILPIKVYLKVKIALILQNILLGMIKPNIEFINFDYSKTSILVRFIQDKESKIVKDDLEISLEVKKRLEYELPKFKIEVTNVYNPTLKLKNKIGGGGIYSKSEEC